ncbi:F0F1 ATP synthase subunit gamma [Martelella soudanensis]|uniref:F0F1 ATP synthase subunit gamma n=1 Tax=unclassified Martelella TaxID=2629616 RepID=UPI0015DD7D4B|nr:MULTISPECIES: FoF1 ATP synthase subunit gamma [unclassified Martelella]
MTQTLERLTRRAETMRSIRGIVRTMKTVSAINAAPYEQAARAIEAYRATVLDGLHAFIAAHGALPPVPDVAGERITIAFGSDHGLCGNYNEVLAGEVLRGDDAPARVICIGAQMEDALAGQGIASDAALLPPANVDGLGRLAGRLITLLDDIRGAKGDAGITVSLVFMQRVEHGRQAPVTRRLLPLDPAMTGALADRPWASRSLPSFSLPPGRMLAALVRSFLFTELYLAAAEALVTENAARLARMQQAERAIDDRREELAGEMRQLRQSEITTELLDVITGFEALKSHRTKRHDDDDSRQRS